MSLDARWIDKIFMKLTLAYGRDFLARWEGIDMADVKTDWGHELSGLEAAPEAIAHALAHLPSSKPPTVFEFRDLCRKAPVVKPLELPAPAASRDRIAAELRKLAPLRAGGGAEVNRKEWAHKLIERADSGEKIPMACLKIAKQAAPLYRTARQIAESKEEAHA